MKISLKQKALLALCFVAFSFVVLNIAARLMNEGFGPFTQVYLRIGLGLMLVFLFFYKNIQVKKFLHIAPKDWFVLFLMGVLGYGLAIDLVTLGVLQTKLLNVAVISSTTPFFVFLFSILVLRKSFKYIHVVFLIITFYGVLIITTKSLVPAIDQFHIGDLYVLLYAAGTGIYFLGRKMLSKYLNNSEIAIIVMVIAFLSSLMVALLFKEVVPLTGFTKLASLVGLLLGGVLNLTSVKLQNFSFQYLDAVTGSQILLIGSIFAPILGYLFYREIILPVEFIGALLVLIGVWFYIRYEPD